MRDRTTRWQKILAQGFASAHELLTYLQLPTANASELAEKTFKTRVPRSFADRMEVGNVRDPLLLQVLAVTAETQFSPNFETDPLKEKQFNPVPGLIHKYYGRVLLTVSGACAINCRYCFRRHFAYADNQLNRHNWQPVLDYIAQNSSIHEVILSGGDPLLLNDGALFALLDEVEKITHVHTLRIHTRIPIVLPERISAEFLHLLTKVSLQKVIVLHSNHPNELNHEVASACQDLQKAGCCLLNQSVLLAGVNNQVDVLDQLSHRLMSCGVLPYYLHLLDKVQGAAHFDVSEEDAVDLYKQLQTRLPGYLVPRLAREDAHEKNKTLIFPN